MAWSERPVVRDGVRLSCRDRGGSVRPIVLLHGLAGHTGERDTTARLLRPRHRVVAADQRGHILHPSTPRTLAAGRWSAASSWPRSWPATRCPSARPPLGDLSGL
ncbi:alpha/beta fold hydrolase [Streptomyces sp. NPDC001380]|uniref:alpha/beta fold hydrolase n=1 Tax=Streptomyces sp. NPDC001380 TaxID=3364566 RepID=UPI00369565B5